MEILKLNLETGVLMMLPITTQKMKFPIKDFFSKCDENCRKLRIWSHLLKKSLMENFTFYVVDIEGATIESIISKFRLHQLINEPMHILTNNLTDISSLYIK